MKIDIKNRSLETDDGFYVAVIITAIMAALAFGVPRCSESTGRETTERERTATERLVKCIEHGGSFVAGNCLMGGKP